MKHLLFYTRFLLYLTVVAVPFFHPAILVPFDLSGIGLWFVIVPVMFLAAFYLSPPLLKIRFWLLIAGGLLLIASLVFGGFTLEALELAGVGALAFLLTVLVFKTQGKGRLVAALEIFFSGVLYFAFLNFSRSSEEIAQASSVILRVLFVLAVVSFFLHAAVIFIASFPNAVRGRGRLNLGIFLAALVPIVALISIFVTSDAIIHEVRVNPLQEELDRQSNPLEGRTNSPFDGNLMDKWKRDRNGKLEGLDAEQWKNLNLRRGRSSGSGGKQYAVMIVATDADTLYLGSEYYGDWDAERGMKLSADEPLNELGSLRLIETWQNTTPVADEKRSAADAEIFSALQERFFAYRPLSFTPTVLNKDLMPFSYGYKGIFNLSSAAVMNDADRTASRDVSPPEREELSRYLEVPLDAAAAAPFRAHLAALLKGGMNSFDRVQAILLGFRTYQYELGFDERVHTRRILDFLTRTKTGDCTEFANATAILARLAGVPSRVVTGFLAARDLQLPKHTQGLAYLQEQMAPLKKYQLEQLLMVTTAHRHAWAQVYIAPYGWLDVEATSFAKPPQMSGDANQWNLVVPRLRKGVAAAAAAFTFIDFLTLVLVIHIILAVVAVLVYAVKFIRLLVITAAARRLSLRGLRSAQKLLLIRLIELNYSYKPRSVTLLEYAEKHQAVAGFAALYTELRYRESMTSEEKQAAWRALRQSAAELVGAERRKRKGLGARLKRFFSLKGFRY